MVRKGERNLENGTTKRSYEIFYFKDTNFTKEADTVIMSISEERREMSTKGDAVYGGRTFSRQEWKDVVRRYSKLGEMYNKRANGMDRSASMKVPPSSYQGYMQTQSTREPSIPKLLLNYFVSMAFEESSLRMAKELGYIKSNKDSVEFNNYYKIRERAQIIHMIKTGEIDKAMETINAIFGVEVLENTIDSSFNVHNINKPNYQSKESSSKKNNETTNTGVYAFDSHSDDDLHFKLLLLNLIEMIRNHHIQITNGDANENDNKFILDLIAYSQEKLTMKAAKNKQHMKELELAMTLLLFPMNSLMGDSLAPSLPDSLKNLYSLTLRSHVADLVNRTLLKYIVNSNLVADSTTSEKFRDIDIIVDPRRNFIQAENAISTNILKIKNKEEFNEEVSNNEKYKDGNNTKSFERFNNEFRQDNSSLINGSSSATSYWTETTELLRQQEASEGQKNDPGRDSRKINTDEEYKQPAQSDVAKINEENESADLSEFQYEPKLVQIIRLWAWTENQLHLNDIGVPRVES